MENVAYGSLFQKIKINIPLLIICSGIVMCMVLHESHAASIISVGIFALYLLIVFQTRPIVFLKYLWFYFESVAAIVGCCIIEYSDIYLSELGTASYYAGATPFLVFSFAVFLITMNWHDDRLNKRLSCKEKEIKYYTLKDISNEAKKHVDVVLAIGTLIGFILIAYQYLVVFRNPAFILGVDRFEYSNMFEYGRIYDTAQRLIRYFLIPCMASAIYRNNKFGWGAIALFIMHSFWTGNKFTVILITFWCFTIIYSPKLINNVKKTRKILVVVGVIVLGLVIAAFSFVYIAKGGGLKDYFLPRIAQQGQLFWKTFDKSKEWHIGELDDEIATLWNGDTEISNNVGFKYGIYKIMYYTAPKTKIDNKLRTNSRYTEGGFAAAYYYMGVLGCALFAILCGILASVFVNYFIYFVRYSQYVRAFMLFRFLDHLTTTQLMFTFFTYFNVSAIISYIVLIMFSGIIIRYRINIGIQTYNCSEEEK